ncbi:MAG: ATP-grasp domain-containing protein [Chloroflexi bacterium]|nr:ATP-grasp domain-containing protein [Chloroflexota bacterium]
MITQSSDIKGQSRNTEVKADLKQCHQINGRVGSVIIGGHFQGLGVLRSLARQGVPIYLLDQGLCIGRFSRYHKRFAKCPHVKQEALFLEFLIDLAKKEKLDGWLIYPNDDDTVCFLAKHKEELEEYYRVTTPSWDVARLAYDKRLTYELAERCGIPIPRTSYPRDVADLEHLDIDFPAIIKPSIKEPFYSRTRKKAIRVDDRRALLDEYAKAAPMIESMQTLMVQELIPGGARVLFSVGSVCRKGELTARIVARRPRQHPMDFGHATTYAETVDIPELEEMSRKLLSAMNYDGLSEVEFMLDPRDGKYKMIEVNARPWGWHTLAISAGVDLPYLSYLNRLDQAVKHNGFAVGVKWVRLTTDIPTVVGELLKGRMKLGDYLSSLRGRKADAVLSFRDPLPFVAEVMMLPYLWIKRGF